jgi:hypothetical protein
MTKIIKLTESELTRIIKRVINEQSQDDKKLLDNVCKDYEYTSPQTKKKFEDYSKKEIGGGPFDLGVACKAHKDGSKVIYSDKDRQLMKVFLNKSFLK